MRRLLWGRVSTSARVRLPSYSGCTDEPVDQRTGPTVPRVRWSRRARERKRSHAPWRTPPVPGRLRAATQTTVRTAKTNGAINSHGWSDDGASSGLRQAANCLATTSNETSGSHRASGFPQATTSFQSKGTPGKSDIANARMPTHTWPNHRPMLSGAKRSPSTRKGNPNGPPCVITGKSQAPTTMRMTL